MFQFAISVSETQGPDVALKMPRVVPDNAEVFACAVKGDLDGLQLLFSQGLASPFDVGVGTGRTPLHVRGIRSLVYLVPMLTRSLSMRSTMIT
jgi:hypothetical protein